jgi:hypothetical protein
MGSITRLVLWLCRKFTHQDLQELVQRLQEILAGRQPEPQPRDDFRQQHPHYRDFYVDPRPPLTEPLTPPPAAPSLDWQQPGSADLFFRSAVLRLDIPYRPPARLAGAG